MMSDVDQQLYVVEVDERCSEQLVGHAGCEYASSPQSPGQALSLVRILIGCPQRELSADQSPWSCWILLGREIASSEKRDRCGYAIVGRLRGPAGRRLGRGAGVIVRRPPAIHRLRISAQ